MIDQVKSFAQNSYGKAKDVMGKVVSLPVFSLILLAIFVAILIWVMVRLYMLSKSAIQSSQQAKIELHEPAAPATEEIKVTRKPTVADVDKVMEPILPARPPVPQPARTRQAREEKEPVAADSGDEWGAKQNGGCKVCNYFYTK